MSGPDDDAISPGRTAWALLLRLLASRWPALVAVLGSAAVFGAAHLDLVHGTAAFLLGGYLAAVAQRAGSLRPTVLCHLANNALAVAGTAGLIPDVASSGAPWQLGSTLALAGACLALVLRSPRLQPSAPPADGEAIPRGLHEDGNPTGPDRR